MTPRSKKIAVVAAVALAGFAASVLTLGRSGKERSDNRDSDTLSAVPERRSSGADIPGGVSGQPSSEEVRRKRFRQKLRALGQKLRAGTSGEARKHERPSPEFLAMEQRDKERFTAAEKEEIDRLYEAGLDKADPASTVALSELIDKYPTSNRAGCAAMNLAARRLEQSNPEAAVFLLSTLVGNETKAVFASGEKVLPKAMLRLGMVKREQGDEAAAAALFDRLRTQFSDEEDSQGVPYGRRVDELFGEGIR